MQYTIKANEARHIIRPPKHSAQKLSGKKLRVYEPKPIKRARHIMNKGNKTEILYVFSKQK